MRNQFVKHGEEAYELHAAVERKCREIGFVNHGGNPCVYRHKSPDVRLLKTPGVRHGSVLDMGQMVLQEWEGGVWQTKGGMGLEAFVSQDNPTMVMRAAAKAASKPDDPKPA